jgi:hypothetical protein
MNGTRLELILPSCTRRYSIQSFSLRSSAHLSLPFCCLAQAYDAGVLAAIWPKQYGGTPPEGFDAFHDFILGIFFFLNLFPFGLIFHLLAV